MKLGDGKLAPVDLEIFLHCHYERSREMQIKAILGRFNGDRTLAIDYCKRVTEDHPKLRAEYLMYKETIEWEEQ